MYEDLSDLTGLLDEVCLAVEWDEEGNPSPIAESDALFEIWAEDAENLNLTLELAA